MIVKNIEYSIKFVKRLRKLPKEIIIIAKKKEDIFKKNPIHSSLRIHELKGNMKNIWSISINRKYRILFERQDNGDIFFISIGKHDIYKYL